MSKVSKAVFGSPSKSSSVGSNKKERLFARQQILDSRSGIEDIFSQAQTDQLAAIDSAITGAQSYASQQANARLAGQGLGASNIDGTMGYVLQNLIPQAMQMRAGIYGNTAANRVRSIEDYLGLLNQNAALSSYSKSKGADPGYLAKISQGLKDVGDIGGSLGKAFMNKPGAV